MSRARNQNSVCGNMKRKEAENAILEANLGREDERIARLYYIDQLPMIDIGFEMGYERKAIGARLRRIEEKIRRSLDRGGA